MTAEIRPLRSLSPREFLRQYNVKAESIESPAMLVFREILERNLALMLEIAGEASRLRPHCKTHKCVEIIRREIELGITSHKCATLAEAEMLAEAGAHDILMAYCLVGPNIERAIRFRNTYPRVNFSATADDRQAIQFLSDAFSRAGETIGVMLDVDVGMHRTGTTEEKGAAELYRLIGESPSLRQAGLHVYDGQNHQTDVQDRRAAVMEAWRRAAKLRDDLTTHDLPVPEIVCGGTGSFPIFAEIDDPALKLSPGTPVLYDAGYSQMFPDLPFIPAAALLTRVISRPGEHQLTFDLGYKAVASDPALEKRAVLPAIPDATVLGQSEEHWMVQTADAASIQVGDAYLAIPWHVCPTTAMHDQMLVVEGGEVVDTWEVTARGRKLTI